MKSLHRDTLRAEARRLSLLPRGLRFQLDLRFRGAVQLPFVGQRLHIDDCDVAHIDELANRVLGELQEYAAWTLALDAYLTRRDLEALRWRDLRTCTSPLHLRAGLIWNLYHSCAG